MTITQDVFLELPVITIITVSHNAVLSIESTIASVLDCGYEKLRYIIVDGGSTDGTVEIIKKYEHRIYHWVSEHDDGIYDAMNKGWAIAPEDSYILFLGAGDRLLSLPENMDRFKRTDVLYGRVYTADNVLFIPSVGTRLKLYNSLHHQALLINKAIHPLPPFNTKYKVYADFDLNQRLYKSGTSFRYVDDLVAYCLPGGVSSRLNFKESLAIIRKNFGIFWASAALLGYYLMKVVPLFRRLRPFKLCDSVELKGKYQ